MLPVPPGPRAWLGFLGHYSTIAPFLWRHVFPVVAPPTAAWDVTWQEPEVGPLRLTGRLRALAGDELLIVLHGLGGSVQSGYMPLALAAAERAGVSCLLCNVRGADLSGDDISHAGLTADLDAVFRSPLLGGYRRIYLLGYSMGGHLALRYASERPDPRLEAVAAVCSPLDLSAAADAIDRKRCGPYRRHVLGRLFAIYRERYLKKGGPICPEDARRIRRFREWDEKVVAPRFGFRGADDYYAQVSVAPQLPRVGLRCLYVGSSDDPMVPLSTVSGALSRASAAVHVHFARGGHLGFAADFDLGRNAPRGVEHQALDWLRSAGSKD